MDINFQQNLARRSIKTVYTNLFAKYSRVSDLRSSISDFQAEFETNRPIRYQIKTKKKYFYRRQTDRRRVRQQ